MNNDDQDKDRLTQQFDLPMPAAVVHEIINCAFASTTCNGGMHNYVRVNMLEAAL